MNELAKAVIVLALAAAAAVWLMGVALHLWPDTGQLAYGNPLPYLKVCMDSGAAKFGGRTSAVSPMSGSGSTSMASSRPLAALAPTPWRNAATR